MFKSRATVSFASLHPKIKIQPCCQGMGSPGASLGIRAPRLQSSVKRLAEQGGHTLGFLLPGQAVAQRTCTGRSWCSLSELGWPSLQIILPAGTSPCLAARQGDRSTMQRSGLRCLQQIMRNLKSFPQLWREWTLPKATEESVGRIG